MATPETRALEFVANPTRVERSVVRTWRELERDARACDRCDLHQGRTKVVFGDGDPAADVMLVGVAPRRPEDLQGRPFSGAAGNLLDNALAGAGLRRRDCYLTTLVKCRPPGDRDPEMVEVESCHPYLLEQIALVRPRVIVTLGAAPTGVLLRRRLPLAKVAGLRLDVFDGVTLVPTYDPARAIRSAPHMITGLGRHLATVKAVLDGRLSTGAEAMADVRARIAR